MILKVTENRFYENLTTSVKHDGTTYFSWAVATPNFIIEQITKGNRFHRRLVQKKHISFCQQIKHLFKA